MSIVNSLKRNAFNVCHNLETYFKIDGLNEPDVQDSSRLKDISDLLKEKFEPMRARTIEKAEKEKATKEEMIELICDIFDLLTMATYFTILLEGAISTGYLRLILLGHEAEEKKHNAPNN